MYEALYGLIDPPRDHSVYNMSCVMTGADGRRQMSVAVDLIRSNKVDSTGKPRHHPIDDALSALYRQAMCGDANAGARVP
jgi:hypothetical protein